MCIRDSDKIAAGRLARRLTAVHSKQRIHVMKSYKRLLRHVLDNGEGHDDRTKVGTRSTFGEQWRHTMSDGFPLLTTKQVTLRWVFEELKWFLSGSTNVVDLQAKGVRIWDEWSTAEQCAKFGREQGDLGPVYGALWRSFPIGQHKDEAGGGSTDQIQCLLMNLITNPNSRRLIVSGWSPYHATRVTLPPCHTLFQLKTHFDSSLSLQLYARSIDIFLGMPYNIASYGLLLKMIGLVVGRPVRELIFTFGDLHLYENHIDQARLQLAREPKQLPHVWFNTEAIEGFDEMTPIEKLLAIEWEHVVMNNYQHHPKIKAPVAV